MISKSCIKLIEVYFGTLDFVEILDVKLGYVVVKYDKNKITIVEISNYFERIGFSEIVNPDIILVEQIKLAAIELIYLANNTNSLLKNKRENLEQYLLFSENMEEYLKIDGK